MIALQYHEVRINLEFRQKEECYVTTQTVGNCGLSLNNGTAFCVPSLDYAALFVDYVFLDTDERRRMAQVAHEYLIEQLQFTGDESVNNTNVKVKLNFNHPVKELVWVVQRDCVVENGLNQWSNYTDDYDNDTNWGASPTAWESLLTNVESGWSASSFPRTTTTGVAQSLVTPATTAAGGGVNFPALFGTGNSIPPVNFDALTNAGDGADHAGLGPRNAGRNPVVRAKLQLNGHDRFQERLGSYFNLVQPYQHHTNVPATGINVYSFCLKPEEHQPSGTCNFSRIDTAVLQLQLTQKSVAGCPAAGTTPSSLTGVGSAKVRVYATNYNVLRIMSGILKGHNIMTCKLRCQKVNNLNFIFKINCNWLVQKKFCATSLNCGDLLRASSTKLIQKCISGRANSPGFDQQIKGKNDEDWTIRSQSPKCDIASIWRRFRDYKRMGLKELATLDDNLRYSPSFYESFKFYQYTLVNQAGRPGIFELSSNLYYYYKSEYFNLKTLYYEYT